VRYAAASGRRDELVRLLHANGYVSYVEAAERFGVSEMTVRRDVEVLAAGGQARRVSGGASLPGVLHALPYEERDHMAIAAKRAIGAAAAQYVASASVIALDAGTTVINAVDMLPAGCTVITHSVPAITAVAARPELTLYGLGGSYVPETRSFAGLAAVDALAGHVVDVAVVSATAFDTTGVLCTNRADAELKRAFVATAGRVILLADSSKLEARAPIRFAEWPAIDTLITDDQSDGEALERLREAGADVVVVETGRP
jgi:DeoR family transcriptional regulator, fructose operon transcriptional repressor